MNEMIKKATLEIDHDGKGKFPHHPPELVDKPPAGADKPQNGISAYHPALAHDLTAQMARSAEGLVKAEVGKQTEKGATDLSAVAAALRQSSIRCANPVWTCGASCRNVDACKMH